jgi:hypothetical protein
MKLFSPALVGALCVVLSSCHKDKSNPTLPPTPPATTDTVGTMKVSLFLPYTTLNCELIISESNGKVLLDTIAPGQTTVNASLRTNATLVDLSMISQYQPPIYTIYTYKGVNPSGWKTAVAGSIPEISVKPLTLVPADILFTHIPSTDRIQFSQFVGSTFSYNYSAHFDSVDIGYGQVPGNTSFLLIPDNSVYVVYKPRGVRDTVDCSTIGYDTATTASFPASTNYGLQTLDLLGITDTTNTATVAYLYNYFGSGLSQQIMYPSRTKMQAYILSAKFITQATNESYAIYNYGSTVNTAINYPPASAYSINSAQTNKFSVTFNTAKPTYYTLALTNSNIRWNFFASPDSSTVNPIGLLTAQNSKLLQGQNLSTVSLSSFGYTTVPAMGFSDYLHFTTDTVWLKGRHVTHYESYGKNF